MQASEQLAVAESPDDSGLLVQPIGRLETIGIIFGTNIGAGVLGMAYAARKTGYLPLLLCLAITCILCTITMLYLTEVALRTRGHHQLSGLARRYLGGMGGWLLFLAVAANSFGALTAYMAGSGNILQELFGAYGLSRELGSILFIVPSVLVLYCGLKVLGTGNKLISIGMIVILLMLIVASALHQDARVLNLWRKHWQYVVPVFNLAVFVFGAQFLVPELVRGNLDAPQRLPGLIIRGMGLTFVVVALIPASVIALVGSDNLTQVATLSWGRALGEWAYFTANLFALLAMLTSYWGLGGCLFTNIFDHFHLGSEQQRGKRLMVLLVVALPPFLLAYSGIASFVSALYFAGTFGGVLMGIMPVLLLRAARLHGNQHSTFVCGWYAHRSVQLLIMAIFAFSGVYAVVSLFGVLPESW